MRRRHRVCRALLLAAGLLGPGPTGAEEPPARRLPEIAVGALEPAGVEDDPTAFRSVIRMEEYAGEAKRVEDVLSEAVGVQVRRFGGAGERAEVSIRGSTASQVVIRLDGVRLNSAQSGAVDLSRIPLALLERIEISRGGGSAQAGSDAIGGVIDLWTRRPGGPTRSDASAEAGSFGRYEGSYARSGRTGEVEYALAGHSFKTDGDYDFKRPAVTIGGIRIVPDPDEAERVNNRSEQHTALLHLGRALGDGAYLSFLETAGFTSRGQPGLDSGSGATAGQQLRAHERSVRSLAQLRLELASPAAPAWSGEARVFHRYEKIDFRDPDPVLGAGLSDPIDSRNENQAFGARLGLEHESAPLGLEQALRLQLEGRLDTLDSNEFLDRERGTLAIFVQQDLALLEGRVRVAPALRYDRTRGFRGRWIPRIGLALSPWPWLRLLANGERSLRYPNLDELFLPDRGFLRGNPDLEPEEAVNADLGFELMLARLGPLRGVRLEGAWFRHRIRDSIVFALVSPFTVAPINTGRADERGYELSGELRLSAWLRIVGNATWLRARLDDSRTPLPGRAERELGLRAVIEPPSRRFKLVAAVQHLSRIPVSRSGNVQLPSRTVYDASLAVDLAQLPVLARRLPVTPLWLLLEGENLGDESVRDARFFPQPGRRLGVRVEASW